MKESCNYKCEGQSLSLTFKLIYFEADTPVNYLSLRWGRLAAMLIW